VILPLLTRFSISTSNLGYFVLNNTSNNNTTLVELLKTIGFNPKAKRLRCIGYIFNLIAEQYLYGQDVSKFEEEYKKAGAPERQKLWRRRMEVGKLHNLVAHVIALGKRTDLFEALQGTANIGIAEGKRWKLVLDRGIRWNSTYIMIQRALELRDALNIYTLQLHTSNDAFD
jgi:hypothetical protein